MVQAATNSKIIFAFVVGHGSYLDRMTSQRHPGPRLREIRIAKGLTLRAAAAALGISHVMWLAYEKERATPDTERRRALSRWTGGAVAVGDWPTPGMARRGSA